MKTANGNVFVLFFIFINSFFDVFIHELKSGKTYVIHGSVLNPIFQTLLLPSRHGMRVKLQFGRDQHDMEFFEDYTELAEDAEPSIYRFKLEKTGPNKVQARYEIATLTTSAYEKYNELFAGGKTVEVAQFMVHNHTHRKIEPNSTEIQDLELPSTSEVPIYVGWQLKSHSNYYHISSRDSWMDNSFLRMLNFTIPPNSFLKVKGSSKKPGKKRTMYTCNSFRISHYPWMTSTSQISRIIRIGSLPI